MITKLSLINKKIANGFSKFFSTIVNKLKSNAFLLKNLVWGRKKTEIFFEKHQFAFKDVTGCEVLKYLKKLKRNCVVGIDEIPASFLKDTAFVIAKPFAYIINISLKSRVFPAKAFHAIEHDVIIQKLPKFGITGIPQKWFCSYFFGKYQQVSYEKTLSSAEPIYCGVPQGSILVPMLFLLYFNDAANVLTKCKIVKYADNIVLFWSHKATK